MNTTTLEQQLKKLNYYKVRYLCRNHVIDASPEDQNWNKDYIVDTIIKKYGNVEPNGSEFFTELNMLLEGKTINDLWERFDAKRRLDNAREEEERLSKKKKVVSSK
jgi:hypothetical protein